MCSTFQLIMDMHVMYYKLGQIINILDYTVYCTPHKSTKINPQIAKLNDLNLIHLKMCLATATTSSGWKLPILV